MLLCESEQIIEQPLLALSTQPLIPDILRRLENERSYLNTSLNFTIIFHIYQPRSQSLFLIGERKKDLKGPGNEVGHL